MVSELDLLRYQNQTLNATVGSLRAALLQKTKAQPVPVLAAISESAEGVLESHKEGNLDSYISHEDDLRKQPAPASPRNPSGNYLSTLDIGRQGMMASSLMVSATEMIEVEEDYLDKQIEKEALMEKQKEFEEMDNLIEAGMEDVRT